MKQIAIILGMLVLAAGAHAFYEDLTLADGTVQTNVFITRVEPDGLSYMHGQGVTKLSFQELSEAIQRKYNYDPEIAGVYTFYTQQLQAEWIQRQEDAARLEAEERQTRLDEISETEAALRSKIGARPTNLKLLQIQEDGSWLCRTFRLVKGGFTPGKAKYIQQFDESQILVEGLPATMADNDEWRGRIYEVGIQQLKSGNGPIRTLRKYKVIP